MRAYGPRLAATKLTRFVSRPRPAGPGYSCDWRANAGLCKFTMARSSATCKVSKALMLSRKASNPDADQVEDGAQQLFYRGLRALVTVERARRTRRNAAVFILTRPSFNLRVFESLGAHRAADSYLAVPRNFGESQRG